MEVQKPRKILDNKYVLKKRIGFGAQGDIYLVEKIDNNAELVVKLSIRKTYHPLKKIFF